MQDYEYSVSMENIEPYKKLINELAPKSPILHDTEMGTICVFCRRVMNWYDGDEGYNKSHHGAECPWVRARILLGDNLPE